MTISKAITLTLICIMSRLHVQAQKISTLMSNAKSATRTDVKISLGNNENEYLPICLLKGKEKGKVFTIIAGVHGYEYPPIVAVQDLMKEIDPEKLNGTIIINIIPIEMGERFII